MIKPLLYVIRTDLDWLPNNRDVAYTHMANGDIERARAQSMDIFTGPTLAAEPFWDDLARLLADYGIRDVKPALELRIPHLSIHYRRQLGDIFSYHERPITLPRTTNPSALADTLLLKSTDSRTPTLRHELAKLGARHVPVIYDYVSNGGYYNHLLKGLEDHFTITELDATYENLRGPDSLGEHSNQY